MSSATRGVLAEMAAVGMYPDNQRGREIETPVSAVIDVNVLAVMVLARAVALPKVTRFCDPVGPVTVVAPFGPVGPLAPVKFQK